MKEVKLTESRRFNLLAWSTPHTFGAAEISAIYPSSIERRVHGNRDRWHALLITSRGKFLKHFGIEIGGQCLRIGGMAGYR